MNQYIYLITCAFFLAALLGAGAGTANGDDWLHPDWDRRIPVTVEPEAIEGDDSFADFTLLLSLDSALFGPVFAAADSNGSDLVLTAGDGTTVLDHELVSYDPVNQVGELWFQADELSDVSNVFYLYYDNEVESPAEASLRASLRGAAWSQDHIAVYHFAEDPSEGLLLDWGPHFNDAVAATAPAPTGPGWQTSNRVDGAVGKAWEYDGVDLYTHTTNVVCADSSFTISAWFANSALMDKGGVAFQGPWASPWKIDFQRRGGEPYSQTKTSDGFYTWQPAIVDEDLHHYVWTMDAEADTARFFLDGIEQGYLVRFTNQPGNSGCVYTCESVFGRMGIAGPVYWNAGDVVDGIVDEYRIIEGVRSPDWIVTEFRNASSPETFYAIGAEEEDPGGSTAAGDWRSGSSLVTMTAFPNPFRGVTWIDVETNQDRVATRVYDMKGRLVQTLARPEALGSHALRYIWDGRDMHGTRVSNGIYYIRAQLGMASVTTKVTLVR